MKQSCISKKEIRKGEDVRVQDVRQGLFEFIKSEVSDFKKECYITLDELNHYRRLYLSALVKAEKGELESLDKDVMEAINNNSTLSENIELGIEGKLNMGQKMADKIATFGGSWTFILFFFSFIMIWISINIYIMTAKPFDPYPFILLNLILSCIAAIQAPIIMMSQNRKEQKDRQRSEQDYKINLKAELEIKLLSEKIDHLIVHQNRKLMEIQEIQTDYLDDLIKKKNSK